MRSTSTPEISSHEAQAHAQRVARTGMIAAAYAALTLAALTLLGSLAWGPVQFRVSEALCVLGGVAGQLDGKLDAEKTRMEGM